MCEQIFLWIPLCLHKNKKKCIHNKDTSEPFPCRIKKGATWFQELKHELHLPYRLLTNVWFSWQNHTEHPLSGYIFFRLLFESSHFNVVKLRRKMWSVGHCHSLSWTEYRSRMASLCTISNLSFFSKLGMHSMYIFFNPSLKLNNDHTGYIWL